MLLTCLLIGHSGLNHDSTGPKINLLFRHAQYGADSRLVNPASLPLERRVRRNDVVKNRPGLQFAPFRRESPPAPTVTDRHESVTQ